MHDAHEDITSLDTGTPLPSRSNFNASGGLDDDPKYNAIDTKTLKGAESSKIRSPPKLNDIGFTRPILPPRRTSYSSPQKISEDKHRDFDFDRRLLKDYFHDLLVYINKNDATLGNDKDGELAFFIRQMPDTELDMTFENWVTEKLKGVKQQFFQESKEKLTQLRRDFDKACDSISSIEDEKALRDIAGHLGLL